MLTAQNDETRHREQVIAAELQAVATELRLIEVEDYVAFIRVEQFANLAALVNSSTEMFFRPGTLRFGFSADAIVDWSAKPVIALDMEFHNLGVAAYFRLLLEANDFGVQMQYISFKETDRASDGSTACLQQALSDAKVKAEAQLPGSGKPN